MLFQPIQLYFSLDNRYKARLVENHHIHYLVWMLKGHLEVKLPKDEELTLYYTVPQLPELPIQLQWFTVWVKIPGLKKKKRTSELLCIELEN